MVRIDQDMVVAAEAVAWLPEQRALEARERRKYTYIYIYIYTYIYVFICMLC